MDDFATLPAARLLDADPRPVFVLTQGHVHGDVQFNIAFRNVAFGALVGKRLSNNDVSRKHFVAWAAQLDRAGAVCDFAGFHWTFFDVVFVAQKYQVFSGTPSATRGNASTKEASTVIGDDHNNDSKIDALRERLNFVTPSLENHLKVIEKASWSRDGLTTWPPELLETMRMMLMLPQPMALVLGDARLLLYNEAYAKRMAGSRHPRIMGMPLGEAWPEGKDQQAVSFAGIAARGYHEFNTPVYLEYGTPTMPEERYCTWTTVALGKELKSSAIISCDVTSSLLEDRRKGTLANLRKRCAGCPDFSSFCKAAGSLCAMNPQDLPFLLFYSCLGGAKPAAISLEAMFPDNGMHITSPFISKILEGAVLSKTATLLKVEDGLMPREWQDLASSHGFRNKARAAVITCFRLGTEVDDVYAIAVVGLNPRRPLDAPHQAFIDNVVQELSAYSMSARRRDEDARFRRITAEQSASKNIKLESFAHMLELSDVGVFEYTPSGKLVKANDAFYILSGMPRDAEAQGDFTFLDALHPEDQEVAKTAWTRIAEHHEPITFELRWKYTTEDLTEDQKALGGQWVVANCLPILNDKGELESITGCMSDIEAQKTSVRDALQRAEALERARATEEHFRLFAENAPIGIYILNTSQQLQYCNDMFFQITGLEKVPYTDITVEDFVSLEDIPVVDAAWKTVLEEHRPVSKEIRVQKLWRSIDGVESPAWVIASSYPLLDDQGEVECVQGAMFDISSLKWAETVQRRRVEEALEAKRQQEHFIDMTSHELRNPLSAVVQCADATLDSLQQICIHAEKMLGGLSGEVAAHYTQLRKEIDSGLDSMQTIESCSAHQKRIIDDILTLSKLDSKLLSINPAAVPAIASIQECTRMFQSAALNVAVELGYEADQSLHDHSVQWVQIDSSRVNQVIINLLTNAIKFTRNEPVRKITIRGGASKERPNKVGNVIFAHDTIVNAAVPISGDNIFLWYSVTDTGCGLSSSQLEKLFHRFSQAFAPRTHVNYGGSGLGLFISRSLSELQGGEVGVYSAGEGQGSTFAFYIAADVALPPDDRQAAIDSVLPICEPAISDQLITTILVVEDNILNAKVLSKQLKMNGFVVHVANHGGEALDFIQTTKHWKGNPGGTDLTVILMDVEMPVMNGLDCTRAIRRLEAKGEILTHIPIIAVSANARMEQMEETRSVGMDDAIAKPFRIPELIPKIRRLVR